MLHDVGDLTQHVLVAGIRKHQVAEALEIAWTGAVRAKGDKRVVEPLHGVEDEEPRVELEFGDDAVLALVVELVIELGGQVGSLPLAPDDVVIRKQDAGSNEEAGPFGPAI